jgi:hypothetical protein
LRRTSPEQIPYECSRHVQYLAEASTSQAYRIGVASYAVRICCPYGQTTVFGTVACTRRDLPILRLVQSMGLPITDIGDTHPMRTSLNGKYCTGLVAYRGSLDPSSSMGRLHHALPPQWDRCYEYHVYVAIGTTTCTAQYRGLKQSSTRGSLKGLGLTSTRVYTPAAFRTSPTRILTAAIGLSPGIGGLTRTDTLVQTGSSRTRYAIRDHLWPHLLPIGRTTTPFCLACLVLKSPSRVGRTGSRGYPVVV